MEVNKQLYGGSPWFFAVVVALQLFLFSLVLVFTGPNGASRDVLFLGWLFIYLVVPLVQYMGLLFEAELRSFVFLPGRALGAGGIFCVFLQVENRKKKV